MVDDERSGRFSVKRTLCIVAGFVVASVASLAGAWATADTVVERDVAAEELAKDRNGGVPAAVVQRRERVLAELAKQPSEEWAGEYYEGDGLGENVTLYVAPASGVAATWFGCMGLYGANEGELERTEDRKLSFKFNRPNDESRFGMFPASVRMVKWGQRRYLIPDDRLIDFVNAINHGMEPSSIGYSMFLLAREDRGKAISGLPDLPDAMLAQIRSTPLLVRVSSVEEGTEHSAIGGPVCSFLLRLEAPAPSELAVGLELSTTAEDVYETARIVERSGRQVTAKMTYYDACAEVKNKPKRGWVLTTGAYAGESHDAVR